VKTAHDPRHEKRVKAVHALFAYAFDPSQTEGVEDIIPLLPEIDKKLSEFATERPLSQVNKLDLAILRIGVFELVYQHLKAGVVIDEAIEIAKEYGSDTSPKFINAVLGKVAATL
jgi:N utilization substance protein B